MSVFKTTFSRALPVIKSDNNNIPSPQAILTSKNTSLVASNLVDNTVDFITLNVQTGDVVYNTTAGTSATVYKVVSATQLQLNATIFSATGDSYTIYQESPQTGQGNQGCYLYVGGAGTLNVITIGGDSLLISGITAGSVLPIQVTTVKAGGTATLVIALW